LEPLVLPVEATLAPPAPYSRPGSSEDPDSVVAPVVVSGIVDAILEVSRQRKSLLNKLRSVLQSGNDAEALQLARRLCGLSG